MANKQTEYSVQQLENLGADVSVSPPVLRRGIVVNSGGTYYNMSGNDDGSVNVVTNGSIIDTNNSTTTPLLADATFTGTSTEILHFNSISLLVHSDVASATNGLVIQFSNDESDWHDGEAYTIDAGVTKFFTPPVQAAYYRVVYTNGGTDQTEFHLHAVLKKGVIKWSSHNLTDNLDDGDDATLGLSVLKLRTAQDNYVTGAATAGGNFKVSIEEYDSTLNTNGLPIQTADSVSLDAFGRWRTSEPTNRQDIEFIYDKQPLLIDEVIAGNATATHNANTRDVTLDVVETNNGTSAALYSHIDVPYTPGSSQLIDITGTLDDSDIGGGTAQLFLRSKISGSVVETTYDQSAWNISTENDLDFTTSQILAIDFQSLKVGRIRFAFVRNGIPVPVHQITNDNTRDSGYWQRPSLPIYWRIYNDATYTYMEMGYGDTENAVGLRYRITANADATLRAICASVKSEGGASIDDIPGLEFSADNQTTAKTVSTTKIPVLSIRPKATFNSKDNRMVIVPQGLEVNTDNPILYEIYYRPTLTNASWTSSDAHSGVEYDVSATAFSGGTKVFSGYVSTTRNVDRGVQGVLGKTILALGRTGTADILSIVAVRTDVSDASTFCRLDWKEIR